MMQEVPAKLELPAFVFHLGNGFNHVKMAELNMTLDLLLNQPWNHGEHPFYQMVYKLGRDFNITSRQKKLRVGSNNVRNEVSEEVAIKVTVEEVVSLFDGLFYVVQYHNLGNIRHKPKFRIHFGNTTTAVHASILDPTEKYR